jgi:protein-disulfide isomerase
VAVAGALSALWITSCSNSQATGKPNFLYKPASKPGVVAKIGNEEITEEILIGDSKQEFFELKKREYDLRMDRLNALLEERLIGAEAKKANMDVQTFIEKKVATGSMKVSEAEYNKFVKEKNIPQDQLKQHPEYKERITGYLENQKRKSAVEAYIAKLTKSSPVEVYFDKPKMERVNVEIGKAPVMGPKDAKVQVVIFSDFECPFCARGATTVADLKKKYGKKVAFSFKHFPLPMHPNAGPASEASMCVHEQNPDKFWNFHDLVFEKQKDGLTRENFEKYAKQVGVKADKFKECLDKGTYKELVQADLAQGEKLGVRSTPSFFVNGQLVAGALPVESFSEMIDEELNKK